MADQLAQQIERRLKTLAAQEAEEIKYNGLIARNRARGLNVKNHEEKQFEVTGKIIRSKEALMRQMRKAEKMGMAPGSALNAAFRKAEKFVNTNMGNVQMLFNPKSKANKERELQQLVKAGIIKEEKNVNNGNRLSSMSARSQNSVPASQRSKNSFVTRSRSNASTSSGNTSNSASSRLSANSLRSKRNVYNKLARAYIETKAKDAATKNKMMRKHAELMQKIKSHAADYRQKYSNRLAKLNANDVKYHLAQEFFGHPIHLQNGKTVRKFAPLSSAMKKMMNKRPVKIVA